jgi:outer membrane murein-binding lipoprotein Lpp
MMLYLDYSPYVDVFRKKKPAEMTDAQLEKSLAKRRAIIDPERRHADAYMIGVATLFSFPIVGFACMAAVGVASSIPMIAAIAAAYGTYKGGGKLLINANVKAVRDIVDMEAEQDVREINRQVAKAEMDRKAAEEKAAAIIEEANRAKQAFNRAIRAGLPLEQAIQIKKKPLALRPKQTV